MNRLEKLFSLLHQIREKQEKLELMYGKDGKLIQDIGLSVIEIIFDEIGFKYDKNIESNKMVGQELFNIINLYTLKKISKEECMKQLMETQRMYNYLEEKKNKYKKNGIYTVLAGEGSYQIVQVKNYDLQNVYICIFRERFKERPQELEIKNLHPEFEYIPIPEDTFLMWQPEFLSDGY